MIENEAVSVYVATGNGEEPSTVILRFADGRLAHFTAREAFIIPKAAIVLALPAIEDGSDARS